MKLVDIERILQQQSDRDIPFTPLTREERMLARREGSQAAKRIIDSVYGNPTRRAALQEVQE